MSKLFSRKQRLLNVFRNLFGWPIPLPVVENTITPKKPCCAQGSTSIREWWAN